MSNFFDKLDEKLISFICEQKIFFVASAPDVGHINLSPKGMDTFSIVDESNVAFMNFIGSTNETSAHILQNGRLTVMFCGFTQTPNILRLYGQGNVIYPGEQQWSSWIDRFGGAEPGQRQIITMHVTKIQTSCGFAVPYFEYKGDRPTLRAWGKKKGYDGVRDYGLSNNTKSIDGLSTGLTPESFCFPTDKGF